MLIFLQLEVRMRNPSQPYPFKAILRWSLPGDTTKKEKPQKGGMGYYINRIELLQHDEMLEK